MAKTKARRDTDTPSGELFIFARFHAKAGNGRAVSALLRKEVKEARSDSGCLAHQAYRSIRDARLFFIHSRWVDERAFEAHLKMPHTVRFAERIEPLLDHELEAVRTRALVFRTPSRMARALSP
jgi:quinol monooxygenase YgiN